MRNGAAPIMRGFAESAKRAPWKLNAMPCNASMLIVCFIRCSAGGQARIENTLRRQLQMHFSFGRRTFATYQQCVRIPAWREAFAQRAKSASRWHTAPCIPCRSTKRGMRDAMAMAHPKNK